MSASRSRAAAPQGAGPARLLLLPLPLLVLLLVLLLMGGCAPAPVRTAPTPTPSVVLPASVTSDPAALVTLERTAAAARDMATLASLWAPDATITEVRAPGAADDYRWEGRDAVLSRYRVAVLPNPPPPLDSPLEATPVVDGDTAQLVNGVDTWRLVRREGRWWLHTLQIGTP